MSQDSYRCAGLLASAPLPLLEAHVAQRGAHVAAVAPELLRHIPAPDESPSSIPGADPARLFRAVASLLADLSHQVPLILVSDDLHWPDGPSLALLRHLTNAHCGRLLMVGTYRASQVPRSHPLVGLLVALRRHPGVSRIHLTGLSPDEVNELAIGSGVTSADADALHERSGGNPFFVTELLRGLEQGEVGLPSGVRETLVHRLSQLGDPAPQIVGMASVLGRAFRLDVLAAMTGFAIDTVLEAMEQGGRAGLVLEMPDEVSRFGFVHALIRETLYQDLSRSRRAQAHLRAAEADPSRAALLAAEGQTLRANQQDARNLIAAERHTLNRRTFTPTDHDTLRAAITHRTTTIYQQAISDRPEWLIEILTELDDRGTLAQLRLGQLRELVKAVAINKDCDIASATVAPRRPSPSMSMPRTV